MVDVVVSLEDGADLDLTVVDVGTSEGDEVLAFTVEGVIRNLGADLVEMFAGKDVIPTEIHFRIEE